MRTDPWALALTLMMSGLASAEYKETMALNGPTKNLQKDYGVIGMGPDFKATPFVLH